MATKESKFFGLQQSKQRRHEKQESSVGIPHQHNLAPIARSEFGYLIVNTAQQLNLSSGMTRVNEVYISGTCLER